MILHLAIARALFGFLDPLPAEIARVRAAIDRRDVTLDEMRLAARGHCCPSCFHGATYTRLAERQERAEAWLKVLEKKESERR